MMDSDGSSASEELVKMGGEGPLVGLSVSCPSSMGETGGGLSKEEARDVMSVKEEKGCLDGGIGSATSEFLAGRSCVAGLEGIVPGVSTKPHGYVPSLLGFSGEEAQQLLGDRKSEVFVPYLGEGSGSGISKKKKLNVPASSSNRGSRRCGRIAGGRSTLGRSRPLSERRKKRRREFGSGGHVIRTLSTINRESQNRPFNTSSIKRFPPDRPVGYIPSVSRSYHRLKYDESTEGFGKTGRYHPEDARLKRLGTWEAIYEDLELFRVPPAWWPSPLSYSDWYSSSSDSGGSSEAVSGIHFVFLVELSMRMTGRSCAGVGVAV